MTRIVSIWALYMASLCLRIPGTATTQTEPYDDNDYYYGYFSQCSAVDKYYSSVDLTANDDDLKQSLQALVYPHMVLDYDEVWYAFASIYSDLPTYPCSNNASYFPDVYSSYCWDPEKASSGGECGNYQQEGDCFNREHIWPKSWFGGFDYGEGAQTDLFELWPTDGYVNGLRGNLPLGTVSNDSLVYESSNGSRIGNCLVQLTDDSSENLGQCFEPADAYKGDFARSYFYLSTVYMDLWSCCDTNATNGSSIDDWMEEILRSWHASDPVDSFELARNNKICSNWQGNRNPFIDYPDLVNQISDF